MSNYAKHFSAKNTPVNRPIPGRKSEMNKNLDGGGFSFKLDKKDLLRRFLILGSESGTYYTGEKELSIDNAENIIDLIKTNGYETVKEIVDISLSGRAPKQSPTIFALALACTYGDKATKKLAYDNISVVCRTGTMLFEFMSCIKELRGWSAGLRKGVSRFYTEKPLNKLDLQMVKYRNRHGFTHRDALRLSHPKTEDKIRNDFFAYAVGKKEAPSESLIFAYERLKDLNPNSKSHVGIVTDAIQDFNLPREAIPNGFLGNKEVWEALLPHMPITALVRNLGKLSNVGLTHSNLTEASKMVIEKLTNDIAISKSRIHPLQILNAIKTYGQGHGVKGDMSWNVSNKILEALDVAFNSSFMNVTPTGKNMMLGIDVSGSMSFTRCGGSDILSCSEGAAAMAMLTARTEESYDILGFQSKPTDLKISPRDTLLSTIGKVQKHNFGSTNCGAIIDYAIKMKIPVDTFVIYTDNETNTGRHPKVAIDEYRQKTGIPAKIVGVSMAATRTTFVDPKDSGMLDVVGFDTATPNIISEFTLGNI